MNPQAAVDLNAVVGRLCDRNAPGRTEATVQSDIRLLLIASGLNISDDDIFDVTLEAPLGDRRRIDIEIGRTVIEVKRSLASGASLEDATAQLSGYVAQRERQLSQRYIGIVTDGRDWHLFHHVEDGLRPVAVHKVDPASPEPEPLITWLAAVLATQHEVVPTREALSSRLGTDSPGHELERVALREMYETNRGNPEIRIKRELWAKLLTTALGTQFGDNEDDLFVEHTLLVATAECVAHAVLGYPITQLTPASLLRGELFGQQSQIHGVVDHDFFDWPLNCGESGTVWIAALARRLQQFDWSNVTHDVMKTIYESVIGVDTRKRLGEYYTPDFLAEAMIEEVVTDPVQMTVLDPSCGSGTFLFHAVRGYLAAAERAGIANGEAVAGVAQRVFGVDVHPVAVTLARVTYLLAIGAERLSASDRGPLRIPVFLGDALQWGQRGDMFASETLNVATSDGAHLFADQLRFPQALLADADRFDALVSDLAETATTREPSSRPTVFASIANRHSLSEADAVTVRATFEAMCRLHDERRDHIWGYYVRNLARPAWLALPDNRCDVLIGNPPWLAYRHMTESMKVIFREMSTTRGLWSGRHVATHQDLADLFVVRAVEQYLRDDGHLAFVMPAGVRTRAQSEGLRAGRYAVGKSDNVCINWRIPWELSDISHTFFPRTACVLFGTRSREGQTLASQFERWTGKLHNPNADWDSVRAALSRTVQVAESVEATQPLSPYKPIFRNGANIYPRLLTTVKPDMAPPLGAGSGRRAVRSERGMYAKYAWKTLPDLRGVVEQEFVFPLLMGESVLPFMQRQPMEALLPFDGRKMLDDADIDAHEGLARWWQAATSLWDEHAVSSLSLQESLDHYGKLSSQYPLSGIRVVCAVSGMHVTACRVTAPDALVEHQLDWAPMRSVEEAQYLCAVLNSAAVTKAVEPYMVSGKGGGRHIGSHLWKLPIPLYDSLNRLHRNLASLGAEAERFVATLEIPEMKAHGRMRARVRESLSSSDLGPKIEQAVAELFKMPLPE